MKYLVDVFFCYCLVHKCLKSLLFQLVFVSFGQLVVFILYPLSEKFLKLLSLNVMLYVGSRVRIC